VDFHRATARKSAVDGFNFGGRSGCADDQSNTDEDDRDLNSVLKCGRSRSGSPSSAFCCHRRRRSASLHSARSPRTILPTPSSRVLFLPSQNDNSINSGSSPTKSAVRSFFDCLRCDAFVDVPSVVANPFSGSFEPFEKLNASLNC
jgi:hypothetical protein